MNECYGHNMEETEQQEQTTEEEEEEEEDRVETVSRSGEGRGQYNTTNKNTSLVLLN